MNKKKKKKGKIKCQRPESWNLLKNIADYRKKGGGGIRNKWCEPYTKIIIIIIIVA